MTQLPILRVQTLHSEYLIDQNAQTFARTRKHEDANNLAPYVLDGEPQRYTEIYLEVGEPLMFTIDGGSWLRSTIVVSFEELALA